MANDAEGARPSRLIWQTDDGRATCDLSGHFWATVRQGDQDEHAVWSWMVVGYENQVLAAGQTGDLSVAKWLVEEWDRWASGSGAMFNSADNPAPIAEDCTTYQPVWPRWHG